MKTRRRPERQQSQPERPLLAKFDLAQTTANNRRHWAMADGLSARAAISPVVRRVIRIRSRYEAENNSWYSGILRTVVNHIVGRGPRLQVLTPDQAANRRIEDAYQRWSAKIGYSEKLRTAVESYWKDGESLLMRVRRPRNFPIQLDIRIFETEQCGSPLDQPILSDHYVDDGIRFDASADEIEYFIFDRHPGGKAYTPTPGGKWYSASEVLHLYRAERPGQTRGIPRATPSLQILPIMRRQELATLYAAESAANFATYLKSNSPLISPTQAPADFAEVELAVNMLTILPAGWELGQIDPKHPGPLYDSFQNQALKSFTRCTNVPYPLAAGTAQDSNFSSYKGDIRNVWKPEVLVEQDRIELTVVEPVFQWFLEELVTAPGNLLAGLPPIVDIPHKWHWPPMPDIDPIDTANTNAIRLSTGQASMTLIHNEQGQDWESEAERAAQDFGVDAASYKRGVYFKTFGVDPSAPAAAPGAPGAFDASQPVGEYTSLNQRSFNNNQKRIRSTLDQFAKGEISQVMAEQTLASIGLSADRIGVLIKDAMDGQVDDEQLQEIEQ
jgi:capsid protein